MTDTLEARHFRLLIALEDEKTLHGAARRLHLTASALSQQLRDLESRLGGPLFHRRWRRLVPTDAARELTHGGRLVLREFERLEENTRRLLSGTIGSLRFATTCAQSFTWLPEVWRSFTAAHPEVEVSLAHSDSQHVRPALLQRRLDLALVVGDFPAERGLDVRPLLRDELMVVVAAEHAWAKRRSIDVRALDGAHLVIDEAALERDAPLGEALAAAGVRPRVSHVPTNGTAVLELVRAGVAIGVLPRWLARDAKGVQLLRLGRDGLRLDWSLALRDEPTTPALDLLIACLREAVATLATRERRPQRSASRSRSSQTRAWTQKR
jgi:LysR family transcriptional regulator, regulator for metE and metH